MSQWFTTTRLANKGKASENEVNDFYHLYMFICSALSVIQLLHVTPGSHKSFQSLATPVLFSAISVCIVMLCFQTNNFDDDEINCKLNQV